MSDNEKSIKKNRTNHGRRRFLGHAATAIATAALPSMTSCSKPSLADPVFDSSQPQKLTIVRSTDGRHVFAFNGNPDSSKEVMPPDDVVSNDTRDTLTERKHKSLQVDHVGARYTFPLNKFDYRTITTFEGDTANPVDDVASQIADTCQQLHIPSTVAMQITSFGVRHPKVRTDFALHWHDGHPVSEQQPEAFPCAVPVNGRTATRVVDSHYNRDPRQMANFRQRGVECIREQVP